MQSKKEVECSENYFVAQIAQAGWQMMKCYNQKIEKIGHTPQDPGFIFWHVITSETEWRKIARN